jgi:PPOX class probable F420-dependent enzyme
MRRDLRPEDLGDLLERPLLAVLATHRADGGVLLSPVWHEWRDGGFNVVTSGDDVKVRHLRRDPRASIVLAESDLPYRGIEVRAEAMISAAGEIARRVATRYVGADRADTYATSDDVVIRLEPGMLRTWDFADDFPEAAQT